MEKEGGASKDLQEVVLSGLIKHGAAEYYNGKLVVDIDRLKNWSSRDEIYIDRRHKVAQLDIIRALSTSFAVPKQHLGSEKIEEGKERPIVIFPESLKKMVSPDFIPDAENKKPLIQPWELGKRFNNWIEPVVLNSGEQTNFAEMAIINVLAKWQADRGADGRLTVIHPKTGERVNFSPSLIKEFAGISPTVTKEETTFSWDSNPFEFASKYLSHLLESGLLRALDFRRQEGSRSAELGNVHDRRMSLSSHLLNFSNAEGQFARYSIVDRKGKIVGTEISVDPKTMRAVKLDGNTVGIVRQSEKGEQILVTINLLDEFEVASLRSATKRKLVAEGKESKPANVSSHTTIGQNLTKRLITKYSIKSFIPQNQGEDKAAYEAKTSKLKDYGYVQTTVRDFFQQAGLGAHNLPWNEQLVLCSVVSTLQPEDKKRVISFAQLYGLKGLRSFLSADLNETLGPKILAMGEKINGNIGKEIFNKYSEIIEAVNQAEQYLEKHMPGNSGPEEVSLVKQLLLKKATELLLAMSEFSQKPSMETEIVLKLEQLDEVKADILLFAATCRAFAKEIKGDLTKIPGVNLEEKLSNNLTANEKSEMQEIFHLNRMASYPEKLREFTEQDFTESLNDIKNTFRILKHEGKMVAFFHYRQINPDTYYVGSLNRHPSIKDSPIALVMLSQALEEKADKNITAVVWADNPAQALYTRFLGLKKVGEIPNYHNTGETYWKLERPKQEFEYLEKAA